MKALFLISAALMTPLAFSQSWEVRAQARVGNGSSVVRHASGIDKYGEYGWTAESTQQSGTTVSSARAEVSSIEIASMQASVLSNNLNENVPPSYAPVEAISSASGGMFTITDAEEFFNGQQQKRIFARIGLGAPTLTLTRNRLGDQSSGVVSTSVETRLRTSSGAISAQGTLSLRSGTITGTGLWENFQSDRGRLFTTQDVELLVSRTDPTVRVEFARLTAQASDGGIVESGLRIQGYFTESGTQISGRYSPVFDATVPEPGTATAVLGLACLLFRRRSKGA